MRKKIKHVSCFYYRILFCCKAKFYSLFKSFIQYSNDMDNIYKNIEEYCRNKKHKILIVFDVIIADMLINKRRNPVVTELFIWGRKFNISPAFITQLYLPIPKNIRLNPTHIFIMKIPNKASKQCRIISWHKRKSS